MRRVLRGYLRSEEEGLFAWLGMFQRLPRRCKYHLTRLAHPVQSGCGSSRLRNSF